MKNKVLATLLAVCLFAGLAVPAFAISSQSGAFDEVTKAEFRKDSYEIKNGTSDEDMKAELMAFASTKQLVQDPEIEWTVENDGKYAFGVSDGKVTCSEDSGSATLIATMKEGKVVAKTKLVATKADAERPIASGFTFKSTTNTLLTGVESSVGADAKGNKITIVPTPSNAYLTSTQIAYLDTVVLPQLKLDVKMADGVTVENIVANVGAYNSDDREYVVEFDTTPAIKAKAVFDFGTSTVANAGNGTLKITFDSVDWTPSATDITAQSTGTDVAAKFVANYNASAATKNYDLTVSGGKVTAVSKTAVTTTYDLTATSISGTGIAASTGILAAISLDGTDIDGQSPDGLAEVNTAKTAAQSVTVKAPAFPTPTANNSANTNNVERRVSISTAAAKQSTTMNAAGTVTIEVGERLDIAKNFKQGPSNANITHDVVYDLEYADTSAQYNDFADIVKQKTSECIIEGVAVGVNKIRATDQTTGKDATITVKVVEKGTKPAAGGNTTVLSAWAPKLGVGETANIVVKADGDVTYKSLNEAVATVDAAGKITAVKEGVAKISVQEEGKDMVYLTVTVGATTTKPEDKPTDVPQTAVAALVALF